jgi:hypothetical protein
VCARRFAGNARFGVGLAAKQLLEPRELADKADLIRFRPGRLLIQFRQLTCT